MMLMNLVTTSSTETTPPMLVEQIQAQLQHHYDLTIPYQVTQFVSHDTQLAHYLSEQEKGNATDGYEFCCTIESERVFIRQSQDTLEFTLYLDETVLASVCDSTVPDSPEPSGNLEGSLDNLCTVMEGVSHAVCLLWHAHHERQIRPVDLELQAEIDKFLLLLTTGDLVRNRRHLHKQLFSECRYLSDPDDQLRKRYQRANDAAAEYCLWLTEQFIDSPDITGLKNELARFYRLSGNAKFDRIRRLH